MEKKLKLYLKVLSQRRALYKLRSEQTLGSNSQVSISLLYHDLMEEVDHIIQEISQFVKGDDDGN
jgi:hypothetical protein